MQDTERLLTYKDVMRATGFRSRTSIWNHVRDHSLPAPLRIGRSAVRWRSSDIAAWLAALPEQHYGAQPEPLPGRGRDDGSQVVIAGASAR